MTKNDVAMLGWRWPHQRSCASMIQQKCTMWHEPARQRTSAILLIGFEDKCNNEPSDRIEATPLCKTMPVLLSNRMEKGVWTQIHVQRQVLISRGHTTNRPQRVCICYSPGQTPHAQMGETTRLTRRTHSYVRDCTCAVGQLAYVCMMLADSTETYTKKYTSVRQRTLRCSRLG